MARKQVDLRAPAAEIKVVASPIAALKQANIQKDSSSGLLGDNAAKELARLAEGFGGLAQGLNARAAAAQEENKVLAVAKMEAIPEKDLFEFLDDEVRREATGAESAAAVALVDAQMGKALGNGAMNSVRKETLAKFGDPYADPGEAEGMLDKDFESYLGSMPKTENPLILAGLQTSMANLKKSLVSDGKRRAATLHGQIRLDRLGKEAYDETARYLISGSDEPFVSTSAQLAGADKMVGGTEKVNKARADALVYFASIDPDAAVAQLEEMREGGYLEGEDYLRAQRGVQAQIVYAEQVRVGFRATARQELTAGGKEFVLGVLSEGTLKLPNGEPATTIAEVQQAIEGDEGLNAQLKAIFDGEDYSSLPDSDKAAAKLSMFNSLAAEGSQASAMLRRQDTTLTPEQHDAIEATNGVRADFDKLTHDTPAKRALAEARFRDAERAKEEGIDLDLTKILGENGRKLLSESDKELLAAHSTLGRRDEIREMALAAETVYNGSRRGLAEYLVPEAGHNVAIQEMADKAKKQWASVRESLGGEEGDLPEGFWLENAQRLYWEAIEDETLGYDTLPPKLRIQNLDDIIIKDFDIIEDTTADDIVKWKATADRNTQVDENGNLLYEGPQLVSINAHLGPFVQKFPKIKENFEEWIGVDLFYGTDPSALYEQINTTAFMGALESREQARNVVATLMRNARTAVSFESILTDSVGFQFIDGGVPLALSVGFHEGTKTQALSDHYIPELYLLAGAASGETMSQRNEAVIAKILEGSPGMDREGFNESIMFLIDAQSGAADATRWLGSVEDPQNVTKDNFRNSGFEVPNPWVAPKLAPEPEGSGPDTEEDDK